MVTTHPSPSPAQRRSARPRQTRAALALALAAACLLAPALGNAAGPTPTAATDTLSSATVQRVVQICASCHGEDGRSLRPEFPVLAGQRSNYIQRQLNALRSEERFEVHRSGDMQAVAGWLDDAAIRSLGDYFERQIPLSGRPSGASADVLAEGQRLFIKGQPERGVRACASCHGDAAEGAASFPRLAGQHAPYLLQQLQAFQARQRPHGILMEQETAPMSQAQLKAVAAWLQTR